MKAVVYKKYGPPDVLRLVEVDRPVPGDDEVLVSVYAASINARDWRLMRADPFFVRLVVGGLLRPKYPILGVDVAGRVEAVGSGVNQLKPGDEVFGCTLRDGEGSFAEFTCAGEDEIVLMPSNLSFEQAAAVPLAALTALQGLRGKGNIQPGQRVVIQGASGGVGTFAVQIAKALGAEVTAVCSTRNVDQARSLGADHVIDYKKEDFTRSGQRYDLILAVNGYHPISHYMRALNPEGIYVCAGGAMAQFIQAAIQQARNAKSKGPKTYLLSQIQSRENLLFLKDLLEAEKVVPIIDNCYPLDKIADAFRYVEDVHAGGKVVISVR